MKHTLTAVDFEQQYLSLRKTEGRIYSDREVQYLPRISQDHPLWKEWKMRRFSANRLAAFLSKKERPLRILEVGCGNGWLSHQLSLLGKVTVLGIDINSSELEQAKRVFQRSNLQFLYGGIDGVGNGLFDIIVFAASLQYFPSASETIDLALLKLADGGEIHIIDTHFYPASERKHAEVRTGQYFAQLGFPSMEKFYFHHSTDELKGFNFRIYYDPRKLLNRIFRHSPFPLICIKKC